jgi:DNA-binding MarR family transcriptional regulator
MKFRVLIHRHLGIQSSLIPFDILLLVKANEGVNDVTIKLLLAGLSHSQTGVRYHLKRLVSDGWITLAENPGDHRSKLMVVTPKFIGQMEKTLSEINLYMEQRALLSSE